MYSGLTLLRLYSLVDSKGQRDGGTGRQEKDELVVKGDPRKLQERPLLALGQLVLAKDTPPINKPLGLVGTGHSEFCEIQLESPMFVLIARLERLDGRRPFFPTGPDRLLKGDRALECSLVYAQTRLEIGTQARGQAVESAKGIEDLERARERKLVELRGGEGELVVLGRRVVGQVDLVRGGRRVCLVGRR